MTVRAAEEDFKAVFEAAPDGILLVDSTGAIIRANPQAVHLFGYEKEELIGQSVELLVPVTLRTTHRRHRAGYVENPHTRPMGIGMELSGIRKDGTPIPVEISLSPLRPSSRGEVIAIVRDLTERRRLKDFGVAALSAAEEERTRIARELHDETAQELAALLMNLTVLQRRLPDGELSDAVSMLRERVTKAVESVRRIARGLRPPELEDVGLAAALRSFVRERFRAGQVEVAIDGSEGRLAMKQNLAAYRIAQEALTNAARHSRAGQIHLRIESASDGREVMLEVVDDGVGFDIDDLGDPDAGLGLIGMEERAQIAGGRLELDSKPGEGTRVRAYLPVGTEVG